MLYLQLVVHSPNDVKSRWPDTTLLSSNSSSSTALHLRTHAVARMIASDGVKLFAEVQKIYRECSPAAAKEMCRLALEAEDERARSVCTGMVLERAWGKPKEYDLNAEAGSKKPTFDPSLYSIEELEQLQAAIMLMARKQGLLPPDEGEDVAG